MQILKCNFGFFSLIKCYTFELKYCLKQEIHTGYAALKRSKGSHCTQKK